MRVIKTVEEYLEEGVIKKVSPDIQRANDLLFESKRKKQLLQKMILPALKCGVSFLG